MKLWSFGHQVRVKHRVKTKLHAKQVQIVRQEKSRFLIFI